MDGKHGMLPRKPDTETTGILNDIRNKSQVSYQRNGAGSRYLYTVTPVVFHVIGLERDAIRDADREIRDHRNVFIHL